MKFLSCITGICFLIVTTVPAICQEGNHKPTTEISIAPPRGWVTDNYGLFTKQQVQQLDSIISQYEKETTIEIGILIIDTTVTTGEYFERYAQQVFKNWGVGKKEKDNGILIVISPGHRRMRITNGFGIEKIFSNEDTQSLIDAFFVPQFQREKYFEGTKDGLLAMMDMLRSRMKKL